MQPRTVLLGLSLAVLNIARPGHIRDDGDATPLIIRLVYYRDQVIRVPISFGTPAQSLDLLLDTTTSDTVVIDPFCTKDDHSPCIDDSANNYTRKSFDKRSSSTWKQWNLNYKRIDTVFTANFGEYNDTATFGGFSLPAANFGIANMVAKSSDPITADGYLGLGLPLTGAMGPSIAKNITQLYNSGASNPSLVTLWLDDFASPNGKGVLTIGDYDWRNCENDDLVNVTLTSQLGWEFGTQGWSIGKTSNKRTQIARIDSTTQYILLPQATMNSISGEINAVWDPTIKSYFVPCEGSSLLPDLIIYINGAEFHVPVVEYVHSFQGTPRCELLFNVNTEWENTHYGPQVRLGHPWLRAYCTVFDFAATALSFTQARHLQ